MKLGALFLVCFALTSCTVYAGHNRIISENSFDDLNYVIDITNTSDAKVRLRYQRISTGEQELPMEDYLHSGESMRLKVKREGFRARVLLGIEGDTLSYEKEFLHDFRPYFQDIKEWKIDNGTVTSITFHPEKKIQANPLPGP